jgi:hypothetical protein
MFKPFLSPSLPALLEEVIPLGIFKNQLKLTKEQFRKKLNCWIFRTIENKMNLKYICRNLTKNVLK